MLFILGFTGYVPFGTPIVSLNCIVVRMLLICFFHMLAASHCLGSSDITSSFGFLQVVGLLLPNQTLGSTVFWQVGCHLCWLLTAVQIWCHVSVVII